MWIPFTEWKRAPTGQTLTSKGTSIKVPNPGTSIEVSLETASTSPRRALYNSAITPKKIAVAKNR
ncbi:hypothetical protein GCM10019996_05270 [Lentilactobacillus parakefiri]